MGRWQRREDAKNLALIVAAGAVGALITGGVLLTQSLSAHRSPRDAWRVDVRPAPVVRYRFEGAAPLSGSDRIYGRVHTVDGREHTGFIRWDHNEGSWTDVLDAAKVSRRGGESLSGVRFGQIRALEVEGSNRALLTLRSGEQVEMTGSGTDLGNSVRGIVVTGADNSEFALDWDRLDRVEFLPVPHGVRPADARLYGTVTMRSGQTFTGRIGWGLDEIFTSNTLDGDGHGGRQSIPFGAIARIERRGSSAAHVVLRSGKEMTLRGTEDVDSDNDGITVSDPALGQVKVDWNAFDNVTFSDAPAGADQVAFDGGRPITGTVVTESGQELTGTVRWDNDEAYTWEMLNGSENGADFEVEFAQIANIRKDGRGSEVTLKDGRSFHLVGSNDVNRQNRGIIVDTANGSHRLSWSDFKELRLDG